MDSPARRRTRFTPRRLPASNRLWVEELEARVALSGMVSTLSNNWSGYAIASKVGAVSSVTGAWTVPAVSGSGTSYSAAWVGIDGLHSATVEQIGTASDLVNGQPQYYAWYEMYPSPSVPVNLTIHPGDSILGQVTSLSSTSFNLTLSNLTTGQNYTTTQTTPTAQRSSAEWVVEAPSSTTGILPLANFKSVTFTDSQATVNSSSGPIDRTSPSSQTTRITLVSPTRGNAEATASNVQDSSTPARSSFTVTTAPTQGQGTTTRRSSVTIFFLRQPDQVASLTASSGMALADAANTRAAVASNFATSATLTQSSATVTPAPSLTTGVLSPSRAAGVAESGDSETPGDAANPGAPVAPPAVQQPEAPGRATPKAAPSIPAPPSDRAPDAVPRSATEAPGVTDVYFIRAGEPTAQQEETSWSRRIESFGVPAKALAGVVFALAMGLPAFRDPEEDQARRLQQTR